jgi:hypothetical protein
MNSKRNLVIKIVIIVAVLSLAAVGFSLGKKWHQRAPFLAYARAALQSYSPSEEPRLGGPPHYVLKFTSGEWVAMVFMYANWSRYGFCQTGLVRDSNGRYYHSTQNALGFEGVSISELNDCKPRSLDDVITFLQSRGFEQE